MSYLNLLATFFPVFQPKQLTDMIIEWISQGRARPVSVIDPCSPSNTTAVLFDEDFVTVSVLNQRLEAVQSEIVRMHDLHCKGMRRISPMLGFISHCNLCFDDNKDGYQCRHCSKGVCVGCFPQGMAERLTENEDKSIRYSCPICRQCFAEFPEASPDTSLIT